MTAQTYVLMKVAPILIMKLTELFLRFRAMQAKYIVFTLFALWFLYLPKLVVYFSVFIECCDVWSLLIWH